ncbi:MAG: xanthine dehydrogenase family protein molybdopterin-binding subunit [Xanthobacteraceae bacterium]|jgi:aerobic carbon-monoxide dehydrogenase large subunit
MDTTTLESRPTPRLEDDPLVRGRGRFMADTPMSGQAIGFFLRSPHAFADIRSIDTQAARAVPGVVDVLTAADMEGLGNVSQHPPLVGRSGSKLIVPHRPALAGPTVRHLGEPVALIVAETLAAAQDAAELISVDYAERTPVIDLRAAMRADAPQIWPEAPGNIAVDWPGPATNPDANAREVEHAFASAAHVARVSVVQQRIMVASMEPRGATASYDKSNDSYFLRCCSQSARVLRDGMTAVMGIPHDRLHVVTEDVGGAFGLKTGPYPEYAALLVAARKTGRPVHWMSSRAEAFLSDNHARDTYDEAELALDGRGRFLALRIWHDANMGAYIGAVGAHIQIFNFSRCLPCMYDIPLIDVGVRCVFTNTTPTAPYRGAGRPEANYLMERVVEEAARVSGIDAVKLRRRNFIKPAALPYKTAVGTTIDSGEFDALLDAALALADYDNFKARRRASAKRGKFRGLGISCMLEHSGASPLEAASLSFPGGEKLLLGLNVQSTGQGHATTFPLLLAQRLGISPQQIQHRHGDSALELAGYASVGSRAAMVVSNTTLKLTDVMLAKGKAIAATALEAAEADIEYGGSRFNVVGTDRSISLFELAARAREMKQRGEIPEDLDTKGNAETPLTFPNGCHIAEVEIDPATGDIEFANYVAVDDCGNALNRMIVEGQVHGSVAQGLGQALLEEVIYDTESGQLVTGSFMDYGIPHADDMPSIKEALHLVPARTNPLGVKGAGEAGTTAAIAAVMNAIADAIPGGAGVHLDMPATPEKIWRACRAASA